MGRNMALVSLLFVCCSAWAEQPTTDVWRPEIKVFSPDIGDSLVRGAREEIHWDDRQVAARFHRITLLHEGEQTLLAEGRLSPPYQWEIPRTIEPGVHYRLSIAVAENIDDPQTAWVSDFTGYFSIIDQPEPEPEPDIVPPRNDPGGRGDLSFTLTWEHDGSDDGPDIDLHVIDPTRREWNYRSERSRHFDYDDRGAGGSRRQDTGGGPERCFWDGNVIWGKYQFFARWYDYGRRVTNASYADVTLNVYRRQPGGEQKLEASYNHRLRRRREETPRWTYTAQP